jgi:hypothetical protein
VDFTDNIGGALFYIWASGANGAVPDRTDRRFGKMEEGRLRRPVILIWGALAQFDIEREVHRQLD